MSDIMERITDAVTEFEGRNIDNPERLMLTPNDAGALFESNGQCSHVVVIGHSLEVFKVVASSSWVTGRFGRPCQPVEVKEVPRTAHQRIAELERKLGDAREGLQDLLGWREHDYEGDRAKHAIEHMESKARALLAELSSSKHANAEPLKDLRKARQYIDFEIRRREREP